MTTALRTVDWRGVQSELEFMNRMALQDVVDFLRVVSYMDPPAAEAYLLDAIPVLIDTYGGAAAELSATWWEDLFRDVEHPPVVMPEPPPLEQVAAQTRWASSPLYTAAGDTSVRLASVVQQHIFGAQRNLVADNSRLLGVRYARYARADACGFCRVLAGRGAVYGSSGRATYVGASGSSAHYVDGKARGRRFKQGRVRGVQKAGSTYHDHCRCATAPVAPHLNADFPDYYDKFAEEYNSAVSLLDKETGGQGNYTMSDITRAMRVLGFGA